MLRINEACQPPLPDFAGGAPTMMNRTSLRSPKLLARRTNTSGRFQGFRFAIHTTVKRPDLSMRLGGGRMKIGNHRIGRSAVVSLQQFGLMPGLDDDSGRMAHTIFDRAFFEAQAQEIARPVEMLARHVGVVSNVPEQRYGAAACIEGANARVAAGDPLINETGIDLAQLPVRGRTSMMYPNRGTGPPRPILDTR